MAGEGEDLGVRDFLCLVEKNQYLRNAILAELGDSEADMQELSRGGDYYRSAVGLPEREGGLTLTTLRDSLQSQGCIDEEIEDVLHLIMQTHEGIPSSLGGSLAEIGRCFIDVTPFDFAGAGIKLPRVWKEGEIVHFYLESRMIEDKRNADSRCLFNYTL